MHELRHKYSVVALLRVVGLSRSTFYHWSNARLALDKHAKAKELIQEIYDEHHGRYGYRRIAYALRRRGESLHQNTVHRLMQVLDLRSRQRMKKYSSHRGAIGQIAPNVLERDFTACEPNKKWVTDITEFKVGDQKLYFSPVKDLFNGEIVAFTMGTRPTFDLVTSMLKNALVTLQRDHKPIVHSDQGWHYQMPLYSKMLSDRGLVQSMSRKGNCHDNASMESFFGVLKSEWFHMKKFTDIETLKAELTEYVRYYNADRIKLRLGGLSPIEYRLKHTINV